MDGFESVLGNSALTLERGHYKSTFNRKAYRSTCTIHSNSLDLRHHLDALTALQAEQGRGRRRKGICSRAGG